MRARPRLLPVGAAPPPPTAPLSRTTTGVMHALVGVLLILGSQAAVPPETVELAKKLAAAAKSTDTGISIVADYIATEWDTTERDKTCLELCSGCGELSNQFRVRGYGTIEFDKETRDENEDLTTLVGLLHAARSALRLRRGGLAHAFNPCKSFVYMSRSFTRV